MIGPVFSISCRLPCFGDGRLTNSGYRRRCSVKTTLPTMFRPDRIKAASTLFPGLRPTALVCPL